MSKANTSKGHDHGYITRLPESDDRTLCVTFGGVLELDEYNATVYQPLVKMVAAGKKFGLLIHYAHDYKGWSKEAADQSFRSIIEHGRHARKLAYVNPPESKIFQLKVAKDLFSGEIRFFEESQLKEALEWIKS